MSLVRISEEGLEKRRRELAALNEEIRALEAYEKDKEEPLWKDRIGPAIRNSMQANQSKLDALLDAPTVSAAEELANVKMLRAAIKAYKHIYDTVENTADLIAQKREKAQRLKEEITRAQAEQGI